MRARIKWLLAIIVAVLLQACGGGDDADTPAGASCSIADQRQSLRAFMQSKYYWNQSMPAPDETAATMDDYFQSMLYRPLDRYSYTQSTEAYSQVFTTGHRIGYGYTLVWADAGATAALRIRNIEPLSPMARAGLRRGDTVLAIDGHTPDEIAQGALATVTTPGVPRTFLIATADGGSRQVTVISDDFALQPVAATAMFEVQGSAGPEQVGYIAYNQFVTYSEADLAAAFAQFAAAGIGDVILDLRYNGGGSIAVSRDLASFVGGRQTAWNVFASLRFNEQQKVSDTDVLFLPSDATRGTPLQAGLRRAFVITSGATASASELLINGLRAFIPVVLVGDTTYGKPYGFVPRDACGINYEAVQFEAVNALGVGGFISGIPPDCQVPDDLDHQLGDPQEARTGTALNYIANGTCGPMAKRQILRQVPELPPMGEVPPPGMFIN